MSFLQQNYNVEVPAYSTALGDGLQCEQNLCLLKDVAMMNDNRQIIDFYSNGYYISNENTLYKVDSNFELEEIYDNKKYYALIKKLNIFRSASKYASLENHMMPDSIFDAFFHYTLLKKIEHSDIIQTESKEYTLLECKLPAIGKKLMCDIQFENAEPDSDFPECHYTISNTFDEIYKHDFIIKPELRNNHQYHILIDSIRENTAGYTFKLYFKNKQGLEFTLNNLSLRLYYQ